MLPTIPYNIMLFLGIATAVGVFITLFFISAPYGRHIRAGWGPHLPNSLGWLVMESPSPLIFAALFLTGSAPRGPVLWIFFAMWQAHYIHRAFIYPFTIRDGRKKMPVSVMAMAIFFNTGNAYFNGAFLFHGPGYPESWLRDPRFVAGLALFIAGYITNRWADTVLRNLRRPGETGYRIPHAGLYRWVSCPNYLGEIVEWCGWALATWSLPGLAFAIWTVANLAPRAWSHHRWYHRTFPEYPTERKALIPFVF